ncbi:protein fantom [Hemibagrus wyckioides]|uniref:protein fantom n=1 Tax=Hemibagrus wyckioides TaxID=337641 RepID=UPI00266CADE9|nr:protein fantom [Hemibagrus wyckioides]
MPIMQEQDVRSSKRPLKVLKIKDLQHVSNLSQKQLEDQHLCLKEESTLLKQHVQILEQKLYRFSTKLSKLRNVHSGLSWGQNIDAHDTIEELKDRVVTLESQKEVLQRKLSKARQQILALGRQAHQSPHMGQGLQQEGEVTQTTQTVPAHYALSSMDDYKGQSNGLFIAPQAVRLTELELAIRSLRETFKLKEKELQYSMKGPNKKQVDELRLTIKNNVNVIRLQKQLSNERTALLVIKEKFTGLKQAYETQLEEGQRSLHQNQEALLGQVGQLSEQLKQEKQKALILEGQLNTATISLHSLAELQERVSDIEGERNLLKRSYNALLIRTLSGHSHGNEHECDKESEKQEMENCRADMVVLKKKLEDQNNEREMEQEKKRVVLDYETTQMERSQKMAMTTTLREKHDFLEQEVLQYRQNVTSLQDRLDRVSKDFQTDVEDLSEILMQIKAFRLQQESCKGLTFMVSNEKVQDPSRELAAQQVSHVETILELQKTRELLVMQQKINSDLQAYMNIEKERAEGERERRRREVSEKDKLLKNRALQINSLQDQLRNLTYPPGNRNQIIPHQYTWTGVGQESVQMMEGKTILNQLQDGGSLLEISLMGATFTPVGLRLMRQQKVVDTSGPFEVVTFCTYSFLDFEMHSTPLVSGTQPNYGFTSCYVLTGLSPTKLESQGVFVHVEVHQALGGVQFITRGRAKIPLIQALQHRGEKVKGRVNITGSKGEIIGVLEFCLCLFSEVEAKDIGTDRLPVHTALYRSHIQPEPEPSNQLRMHSPARSQHPQFPAPKSPPREPGAKWIQFPIYNQTGHTRSFNHNLKMPDSGHTSISSKQRSSRHHSRAMEQEDKEKGESSSQPVSLRDQMDSEVLESLESITTSDSDVVIPQLEAPVKQGCRLKIEILSLLFDPSSSVALDQSVQQVYVEYRLLGIPRETTETPVSLQKPTEGEEIHFNFSRVIHVDSMKAAPLKQYLYTKLERTDAKQGRLKFTVVSEPLNEEDECVDVGHAYLDLQELLLTGNDVTECQIDIVRMDDDQEVVGRLKVSLEAAQALTGISWENPN